MQLWGQRLVLNYSMAAGLSPSLFQINILGYNSSSFFFILHIRDVSIPGLSDIGAFKSWMSNRTCRGTFQFEILQKLLTLALSESNTSYFKDLEYDRTQICVLVPDPVFSAVSEAFPKDGTVTSSLHTPLTLNGEHLNSLLLFLLKYDCEDASLPFFHSCFQLCVGGGDLLSLRNGKFPLPTGKKPQWANSLSREPGPLSHIPARCHTSKQPTAAVTDRCKLPISGTSERIK